MLVGGLIEAFDVGLDDDGLLVGLADDGLAVGI